jgi:hypothetical protein
MLDSATIANISGFIEKKVIDQLKNWAYLLYEGQLYSFEVLVQKTLQETHDFICEEVLPDVAQQLKDRLQAASKLAGNRKFKPRNTSVRISTGHIVKVPSLYIGIPVEDRKGSRHLINNYWKLIGGSSPLLYDRVGYCSALCPSYEVANQTLSKFGVHVCLSSVRDINNRLANHCMAYGEEHLIVSEEETLAGKKVILSLDGGRTRLRKYDGKTNDKGHATYHTAWCEPKLFVIDILGKNGKVDREELPIYGVRFSEDNFFKLLERHLIKLNIKDAQQVQIIADGAPWIWNKTKPILEKLGVPEERIIETLDVYHATQYVNELVEHMPRRIEPETRKMYLKLFKKHLWEGDSDQIVDTCKEIYKRPNDTVRRCINYLDKHHGKMQYAGFQSDNLMCGSGIVESAIRRVINLRFKNASTFWKKEIVEKLYFFRGAVLSQRWDILIYNIIFAP